MEKCRSVLVLGNRVVRGGIRPVGISVGQRDGETEERRSVLRGNGIVSVNNCGWNGKEGHGKVQECLGLGNRVVRKGIRPVGRIVGKRDRKTGDWTNVMRGNGIVSEELRLERGKEAWGRV